MTEGNYRTWDVLIKCIGIAGGIIAFIWGIYQYVDTQAAAVRAEQLARDRAFAQELFSRRVEEYRNVAAAAGRLSVPAPEPEQLAADVRRFEQLYWSSIATVNSVDVVSAMDYLRSGVENYQQGRAVLGDIGPEDQLKIRARALTRTLREATESQRKALAAIAPTLNSQSSAQ